MERRIIQDKSNFIFIIGAILFGGIGLFLAFDSSFALTTKDTVGLAAIGSFTFIYSLFIVYRFNVTQEGIQPISIIRRPFLKWHEIRKITWRVDISYSRSGINFGTHNLVKICTSKGTPFAKTIRFKIWNEPASRDMEDLLHLMEVEKGVEVEYISRL